MIYVASRASVPERSAMWRRLRAEGWPIISTWIDDAGDGEVGDFTELWGCITREIGNCKKLVLYAEQGDFPLKGAMFEAGIALGMGRPVVVCLPGIVLEGRTLSPVGSWIMHPDIRRIDDLAAALEAIA